MSTPPKTGSTRRPSSKIVRWVVAAAVLVGGIGAGFLVSLARDEDPEPAPEKTVRSVDLVTRVDQVGVPPGKAGCSEVEEPKVQPAEVFFGTEEGVTHPPYSSTPPTSGWHYLEPIDEAIYYQPHDPEALVANLAEGDVVVYHTGLTDAARDELIGLFVLFESNFILAVPGDDLGLEDEIVLTAWGKLQRCERLSGEAIESFFYRYRGQGPGLATT